MAAATTILDSRRCLGFLWRTCAADITSSLFALLCLLLALAWPYIYICMMYYENDLAPSYVAIIIG
jgi:hypothetical protein